MKNPRFLNLIRHDWERSMYSLHRLDPMKHLFHPSSARAREAAAGAQDTKKPRVNKPSIIQCCLPEPEISFHPTAGSLTGPNPREESFSLLGRDGVVFTDYSGRTSLYDTARGVFTVLSPMNSRICYNRPFGISLPVIQDAGRSRTQDDRSSLYVMNLSCDATVDKSFEVLAHHDGVWSWRTLPGPPFLAHGGPPSFRRPTIQSSCYAAVDDGATICISSMEQGIGTYAFDTASHVWRHVGPWVLPFHGRAEYVPELKLWLGLSMHYSNPSPRPRLCAFDLSAMDAAPPQHAWDYLDYVYPEEENKKALIHDLHLVNLGDGMFCIATHFRIMWSPPCTPDDEDMTTDDSSSCISDPEMPMTDIVCQAFLVLTGVKVERCCSCDGVQMIKHKSRRYDLRLDMKAVL